MGKTSQAEESVMPGPLVTVSMGSWNRADLVAKTIESVLSQTLAEIELYVHDDVSTDGTGRTIILGDHDQIIRVDDLRTYWLILVYETSRQVWRALRFFRLGRIRRADRHLRVALRVGAVLVG